MRVCSVLIAMLSLAGCSTTVPVAVIGANGQILRGTATAAMDGGSFMVTDRKLTCAGSYDSWDTSVTISMPVHCSDGRKGLVIATRDASGISGLVGSAWMTAWKRTSFSGRLQPRSS